LRRSIAARNDDDSLILEQLTQNPDVDVYRLLIPLFERHGLPVPPLVPEGAGIDRFGFPDCPPALGDKITVAMTAFNADRTIEHAIRSVVNQTWRNLEIFIVDDASTDGTAAVIEKYAAIDDRIVPLHNPVNIGTYCSKNRALEGATGRWFTCHDADDWSHPMKIERQVEALIRTDAVANTSQWIRSGLSFPVRLGDRAEFVYRNYSSLMFQTAPVRDYLGFYDSVLVSADAEFIERLQKKFGCQGLRDERYFASLGRIQPGALTSTEKFKVEFRKTSNYRREYFKNFRQWHRDSDSLYIPINHEPRKFFAPVALIPSHNCKKLMFH
jgi:glycosyltransferase involved in cell wall biosynthesis